MNDYSSAPIDIHTHIVPKHIHPPTGARPARWPEIEHVPGCNHAHVIIDGRNFRTITDECWSVERRAEAMQSMGIGRQALSPMPVLLSYWLDAGLAREMARQVNEAIAQMVTQDPVRFCGLGMVPLQDPELAARELETLMRSGLFRGVEIGSNVNGTPIGDPRFEDFFQTAEELGAAVFVHALHPAGLDRLVGPPALAALIAFPCETAFAIASLITGGVILRHPRLRMAFSHGGGAFASILPRLSHGWRVMDGLSPVQDQISPLEQARALYYDTLVYDPDTLRFLIERFGASQLCIGTDHPFQIQEPAPVAAVDALALDETTRGLLLSGNARRFLGET